MSLRRFLGQSLVVFAVLTYPLNASRGQTEQAAGDKPPSKFHAIPDAKIKEFDEALDAFHQSPSREDFAKLEEHIALIRKATGPAADGQVWPQWFYQQLQEPEKRDSDSWKAHFEKLDRWIAAFPDSPTPLIVKAAGHILYGWEERGSGFANSVSEAQWAVFRDQIDRAQELLEKAIEKPGHDAEVYAKLVVVGMAQGADRETIDEYLAAARKIDPNYFPIYGNIAVDLLPRWGGDPGDIGEFAEQVLKENPGEAGLEIYARIAAEVNQYDLKLLLEGEFDLEKVRAGMKIVQARYPNAYFLHNFAGLVGWRTQDLELAKAAREAVDKHYARTVWGGEQPVSEFKKFCDLKIAPPKQQRIVWSLHDQPRMTAISPSGNSLVIAYQAVRGAPLVIRSMKDLSTIEEIPGLSPYPQNLTIDQAGKKLAVSYLLPDSPDGALEIYNVGDWDNPRLLADPQARRPGELRFSPDGKLLAVGYANQHVGLWNLESGKLERMTPIKNSIHEILFSPDGTLLVVRQAVGSLIFEAATGKELHRLPFNPSADGVQMTGIFAFHEDGRLLTTGTHKERGGQSLMLWDRVNKKRKDLLPDVQGRIAAISPKGTFLVVSKFEQDAQKRHVLVGLQIWSLKEGKMLAEYGVVDSGGFAFSPDEKSLALACSDRSVRVWDLSEFLPKAE